MLCDMQAYKEKKMLDAQGVQAEGKPAEVSTQPEQAADGVEILDVTKKYRSKRNPDVSVSGDELWAGYSRGRRYDDLQSKHQQLESQDQAKTDKLAAAEERVAQLEADARMAKAMQNLGIGASGQRPVAQDDGWDLPGEGTAPANPLDLASRFESLGTEMKSQLLNPAEQERILREEAARIISIEQGKREAEESNSRAAATIRRGKLATLKVAYPDISDDALEGIVGTQSEYLRNYFDANALALQGDQEAAMENVFNAEEKLQAMLAKQFSVMQQQATISAEREKIAELESLSGGGSPKPGQEEEKPTYNWHEGEDKRKSRVQRAKELVTRRQTLKGA
jgi:hypothetical protein